MMEARVREAFLDLVTHPGLTAEGFERAFRLLLFVAEGSTGPLDQYLRGVVGEGAEDLLSHRAGFPRTPTPQFVALFAGYVGLGFDPGSAPGYRRLRLDYAGSAYEDGTWTVGVWTPPREIFGAFVEGDYTTILHGKLESFDAAKHRVDAVLDAWCLSSSTVLDLCLAEVETIEQ